MKKKTSTTRKAGNGIKPVVNGSGGIQEFNCLREDESKPSEYIFFGTEIEPIDDKGKAIERVKSKVAEDKWDVPIWICGYWKGGGCYTGGEYITLGGWERAN